MTWVWFKGIGRHGVALGARGKMDAETAALEPVAVKIIFIGVIDKEAFFSAAHGIAGNVRAIREIEKKSVIAIAIRHIVPDFEAG